MKHNRALIAVLLLVGAIAIPGGLGAQNKAPSAESGVSAHFILTAEGRQGATPSAITPADIMITQARQRDHVTNLLALNRPESPVQLMILIDDGANTSLGTQFSDLRNFINSVPAPTQIGIGYMRNGAVQVEQDFTADHARAAQALRLPMGTNAGSPYDALDSLMKSWGNSNNPREILMITDGIEPNDPWNAQNQYVDSTIEALQRNGVPVFSIFASGAGHSGHDQWRLFWGQNYLSELADATGAESYVLGYSTAPAFAPYLRDLSEKLAHQYRVTFDARSENKSGLEKIKVTTELAKVDVLTPTRVWVPAGM